MWPRLGTSELVSRWIVVTLAVSIIAAVDGGFVAHWASLDPSRVVRGELWRLVTWPLVVPGPIALVVTCAAIYKFGGELAIRWGDRRLRRFTLEVTLAAAVVACLLALAVGSHHTRYLAGWALADALVIAWARQFPQSTLLLYGMVALHGRSLINVTFGINVVFAIFLGPITMAPELAACVIAAAYPRDRLYR